MLILFQVTKMFIFYNNDNNPFLHKWNWKKIGIVSKQVSWTPICHRANKKDPKPQIVRYLFRRFPQNISDPTAAPQTVAQDSDDTHEQRVTRPLLILNHDRSRLYSHSCRKQHVNKR